MNLLFNDHHIRLDLGNFCNLKCPSCFRTTWNAPWLNTSYTKLDEVKQWFPPEFLDERVKTFNLNGASSEPTLNPQFMEIVEYLSPYVKYLKVSSNGSTRTTDWWYQLGKKQKTIVYFSVDTLTPGNELYRINAQTEKIVENLRAYTSAGGKAILKQILFKHGQHEVENFEALAKELGCEYSIRPSYDFSPEKTSYEVTNNGKTYTLEKNTTKMQKQSPFSFSADGPQDCCDLSKYHLNIVTYNGIVYPCCFVEGLFFKFYEDFFLDETKVKPKDRSFHPRFYDDFIGPLEQAGGIKTLSLRYNTMEEILTGSFYRAKLPFTWKMKKNVTCAACPNFPVEVPLDKFDN